MDEIYEAVGPEVPEKPKEKKGAAILRKVLGVLFILLGLFLVMCGTVSYESETESDAASLFDPYYDTDARQFMNFNMITDPVASFTLGENHSIYIAMDWQEDGPYFYLLCLSQADFDSYSDIYDFTFDERDLSEAPRTARAFGYAVEIEDDLRDYTLEYFNQLFGGEITLTEAEFEDCFGSYYLDTTVVPKSENTGSIALILCGLFLAVMGIVLIALKKKPAAPAAAAAPSPADDGAAPAWELAPRPNYALGLVGALLGSLVGAVVWVLLYRVGYLAGIAGFLSVFCAIAMFQKLGHGIDKLGTVLSVLVALAVLVLAGGFAYAWVIVDAINESTPGRSSIGYVLGHFSEMMETLDLWGSFAADMAMGLLLGVVAGIGPIISAFKGRKKEQ